ncbi:MAG TPA: hypothetical protein VLD39_16780, partial [Gammaproteobacteria bacterium]|nr:hypothetical protein [Gammaproteobacteria bacterium]
MRYAPASCCVALSTLLGACPAGPEGPVREIVPIAGDLYRARDNNHFTVYLVTPEGIILADPLNADFATWLKAELGNRYAVPVRYVLYSHYHWD